MTPTRLEILFTLHMVAMTWAICFGPFWVVLIPGWGYVGYCVVLYLIRKK